MDSIGAEIIAYKTHKHLIRITCIAYVESILILCVKRRSAIIERIITYRSYAITNRHACKRIARIERRITYRSYAIGDYYMSYVIIVVKRLRIYISNRQSFVLGGYLYLLRSTNVSDNLGVGAVGGNLVYYTCGITDKHAANCTYSVLIQSVLGVICLSVTIFALSPMVGSVGCVGSRIGVIYHGGLVAYDSLATLRAGLSCISYRVTGGGRDNYNVLVVVLRAVLPLYCVTA